jgi:DNA-binding Lrp family transcriptional regulator
MVDFFVISGTLWHPNILERTYQAHWIMNIAYILLNVAPGKEDEVLKSLKTISGVSESYRIYGVYDTIVKVERESQELVKTTVMQIRGLKNIRSTLTLTVV